MSLKTLTMTYLQWDDTPATGEVEFELVVTTQSLLSIYPRWIETVVLGETPSDPGEGSISIKANDSSGLNPADSYYLVRERIDGVVRQAQYKIQILEVMASPISLADLRAAALDPVALTPDGTPLTSFYDHIALTTTAHGLNLVGTLLGAVARTNLSIAGTPVGTRRGINVTAGTGIAVGGVDNAGAERLDLTISATGTSTIAGATDYDNTPPGTPGQVIIVADTGFAPGDDTAILVHDPTITGNPFSWPMVSLRTALSTVYAAIATAISDLGLGTAATHDVPASGNAGPTQVVLGNDTRLGAGPYLDSEALDGTMGDDFAGSSLDGRWTRYGITSGMETYQPAASALITDISIGTAALYTQALPSGDGTYVASLSTTGPNAARMFGLFILDSGGGGRGVAAFTDNHFYGATISAYAYAAFWADLSSMGGYAAVGGVRVWFRLRKTATVIGVAFSLDGTVWSHETTVADSSAWTRIAVGRVYGTGTDDRLIFHRFNRTA